MRWTKQIREYIENMDSLLCYTTNLGHESWPELYLIYLVTLQKLLLISKQISTENSFLDKGETFSVLIHLSVLFWIVCLTWTVLVHVRVPGSSQVYHFCFILIKDAVFFRVIHHLQLLLSLQNLFHNDSLALGGGDAIYFVLV